VFLRVHARYLTKAAQSSTSTLAAGGPGATALAGLATTVARDLDRLARSGSDRSQQRRLAIELARAAARAGVLGQGG
jgi:hypothetical protein